MCGGPRMWGACSAEHFLTFLNSVLTKHQKAHKVESQCSTTVGTN
jgi:hypothetical protein